MKNITGKRSDPVRKIINIAQKTRQHCYTKLGKVTQKCHIQVPATTAHCHDQAAIKIHITTFNRINLHVRCENLHNFNCFWLSISFFFVLVKAILHL